MQYTIDVLDGYIKAEMKNRETAEETRTFVEAIIAALAEHKLPRVLISIRSSRPVFKVEKYGLSDALSHAMQIKGLKVAFVSDAREVAMSQEYIVLLARQRGLAFKTFDSEAAATKWLLSDEAA
jgi:hypothetical protein